MSLLYPRTTFPSAVSPSSDPSRSSGGSSQSTNSASVVEATATATGSPIRIIYGDVNLGADIFAVGNDGANVYIACGWGQGAIESISSLTVGGEAWPVESIVNYLGSNTQPVDPWLKSSIQGFNDPMQGVAYTVVKIAHTDGGRRIDIKADIKGLKVYNPSTGGVEWGDNPALCMADFIQNPDYGMGLSVDFESVKASAAACDALLTTGEKRCSVNLAISDVGNCTSWLETIAGYGGIIISNYGGKVVLTPDYYAESKFTLTESSLKKGSFKSQRLSRRDVADYSVVEYTGGSVRVGGVGQLESRLTMLGIKNENQAKRVATEVLNRQILTDLVGSFTSFSEAEGIRTGDVISLDFPRWFGGLAKPVRVFDKTSTGNGTHRIEWREYQDGVYGESVSTGGGIGDSNLPDPTAKPLPVLNLQAVERQFVMQTGIVSSRILITWEPPEDINSVGYSVNITAWGESLTTQTISPQYLTAQVVEGESYTIAVSSVTMLGVKSDPVSAQITPLGKYYPPENVKGLAAYEVGGDIHISWQRVADLDLWAYEVRISGVNGTWETAEKVNIVHTLLWVIYGAIKGDYKIFVKAIDSVGVESVVAAEVLVSVTIDSGFVSADESTIPFSPVDLTGQYDLRLSISPVLYSDDGSSFDDTSFQDNENQALLLFMCCFPNSAESNVIDLEGTYAGDYSVDIPGLSVYDTGVKAVISASTDSIIWVDSLSVNITGSYRYFKAKLTGGTLSVVGGIVLRMRFTTITKTGSVQTSTTSPAVVDLSADLSEMVSIGLTAQSSTPAYAVFDNVRGAIFDVYAFDNDGVRLSIPVHYTFEGI